MNGDVMGAAAVRRRSERRARDQTPDAIAPSNSDEAAAAARMRSATKVSLATADAPRTNG
jgi:hypothetical protein